MAPNCPKCSKRVPWWAHKQKPFPCPSCGAKLTATFPKDAFIEGVIFWCVISFPLYLVLSGIIRIGADLALLVLILSFMFYRFGSVSLAPDEGQVAE